MNRTKCLSWKSEQKERPIIFSNEMVRALLDGRKTQTRRIVKPQPEPFKGGIHSNHEAKHPVPYIDSYCGEKKTQENPRGMSREWHWWTEDNRLGPHVARCPYGIPGDRLWVRETAQLRSIGEGHFALAYQADGAMGSLREFKSFDFDPYKHTRWTPSIHMPRWASRLTLEITDVHVQRLQEITEEDAKAEGVENDAPCSQVWWCYRRGLWDAKYSARDSFKTLWNAIHGPNAWNLNPWVWAISFKKYEPVIYDPVCIHGRLPPGRFRVGCSGCEAKAAG